MSEKLEPTTSSASTSSVEGSRARTLVPQDTDVELMGRKAAYGVHLPEYFAHLDRDTQSWKTSQICLFGGRMSFSETWPPAGTMRNGKCYRHVLLVCHMSASEYSLLPTPIATADSRNATRPRRESSPYHSGTTLADWLKLNTEVDRPPPSFVEWMMGFPLGWTDLKDSETQSCPRLPNGSDGGS